MKNKWFIAIKKRHDTEDLFDLGGLTHIEAPEGHYYADPFLADSDGRTFLFFEDYDYSKGRLAVGELDDINLRLQLKNVRPILELDTHLSFPSVLLLEGQWYMTPENVLGGELVIYRAVNFPDQWEPIKVVAQGRYDDPVLRQVGGKVQLWTSEDGDKLRVFEADSLDADWRLIRSHDERFARSAGHFIGDVRPVQDSVPVYGRAIRFKHGDKVIREIEPTWYPGLTGTHTFNVSNKYVVVDGRIKLK